MAEIVTVARPYAEAAFKTAVERDELAPMAGMLALVAAIAADAQMRSALGNPKVSAAQKKELFFAVGGERLNEPVRNLVSLLVDNHRAELLPSIAEQFEALKREREKVVRARITAARPLEESQKAELVQALERQYGRKVETEVEIDPELLGGARVQVGDEVIHASVRDALAQMAAALAH